MTDLSAPHHDRARAKAQSVLVYDDDQDQREVLKILLADLGCNTQLAGTHVEFLSGLEDSPDYIVLDLMLIGPDAVDLLDVIAEQAWQACLIFVSGHARRILRSVAALANMRGLRVAGVIKKPVQLEALGKLLKRHLDEPRLDPDSLKHSLDQGHFGMEYAPQIHAGAGKIVGLVSRPFIQPRAVERLEGNAVLRQIRAAGLAREYFQIKIETLIKDVMHFHAQGLRTKVSIRLGPEVLIDPEFCLRFEQECRRNQILMSEIAIAVDESELTGLNAALLTSLIQLSLHGCDVIVDGARMGVPFSDLERCPYSEIRIDARLVKDAAQSKETRRNILELVESAQEIESRVAASGVASIEDIGWLTDLGVTNFQGNAIAGFQPATDICHWLQYGPKALANHGLEITPMRLVKDQT